MVKLIYLFSIVCISLNLGSALAKNSITYKGKNKRTLYFAMVNNHKVECNIVQQNRQGSYTMSNCEDYNTYLNVNNIEMKVVVF